MSRRYGTAKTGEGREKQKGVLDFVPARPESTVDEWPRGRCSLLLGTSMRKDQNTVKVLCVTSPAETTPGLMGSRTVNRPIRGQKKVRKQIGTWGVCHYVLSWNSNYYISEHTAAIVDGQ